jgi:cytochrome c-type biogenesis protein CcmH
MKINFFFLVLLVMLSFKSLHAIELNNEILKNKILKNIRCLICQGQSVYDSQSDFAISMKLVIDEKINEGLSENEIYDYLKDQYGQWISYDPEFNKKTFILWGLPILLFAIGGVIVLRKLIVLK